MKGEKIYNLPDIGTVRIYKNPRSKRMNMRVKPFEGVVVSIPSGVSYQTALDFVFSKKLWLKQALQKIGQIESSRNVFLPENPFFTQDHELKMIPTNRKTARIIVQNNQIQVLYPEDLEPEDEFVQKVVRKGIEMAWKIEATYYLPVRLAFLAKKHQLNYNGLSIKITKSRWGSCNQDNQISLSAYLMKLPQHLVDYVILHELAHTLEKNHSPRFWKRLSEYLPNARQLDKELNQYKTGVW